MDAIKQNTSPLWSPYNPNLLNPIVLEPSDLFALQRAADRLGKASSPNGTKRMRVGLIALGVIVALFGLFLSISSLPTIGLMIALSSIPVSLMNFAKNQRAAGKLAYFKIAQRNQWVYAPECPSDSYENLRHLYPAIFNQGARDQKILDQFWGKLSRPAAPTPEYFWMANFTYTIPNGKEGISPVSGIYAFPLPRPVPANFALITRHSFYVRATDQTDIETESSEFNSAFTISYQGDRGIAGPGILETLTPNFQDQLLLLKGSSPTAKLVETIGFYGNVLLVGLFTPLPMPYGLTSTSPAVQGNAIAELEEQMVNLLKVTASVVDYVKT